MGLLALLCNHHYLTDLTDAAEAGQCRGSKEVTGQVASF
jgi:hypothetical protein